MKRTLGWSISVIVLLTLCSCSAKKSVDMVHIWPKAPKPPKLVYVKSHRGAADFAEPSFLDVLLGKLPASGFRAPYGIAVKNDTLYVALSKGSALAIVDTKGKKITYVGDKGRVTLENPLGVAVAANGIVYVTDPDAKLVLGFGQDGIMQFLLGANKEFERPVGIAVSDSLQRLYIVDTRAHQVKVVSLSGERLFEFGKRGNADGDLNYPVGIAIDKRNGNVVVVDSQNFRVQVFDRDGKFIRKFGQAGDGYGSFGMPKFVAVDREGGIYVTDGLMQNFQVFDQDGNFLLYVMGAEKGQAGGQFVHPGGIFMGDDDRLYLTEVERGLIHEYQYLSQDWIKGHPEEHKKYLSLQPLEAPAPSPGKPAK